METYPEISGGNYNPNMCQLAINDISSNYTGIWTVQIQGGKDGTGDIKLRHIQITTTRVADVIGDNSLSVTSGQRFEASCEASFGIPKPAGFRWEIDNEKGAINNWNPCL